MLAEAKEVGCMCMRRARRRILPRGGQLSFWQLMPRCGSNVVEILITVILVADSGRHSYESPMLESCSAVHWAAAGRSKTSPAFRGRGEVLTPELMPVGPWNPLPDCDQSQVIVFFGRFKHGVPPPSASPLCGPHSLLWPPAAWRSQCECCRERERASVPRSMTSAEFQLLSLLIAFLLQHSTETLKQQPTIFVYKWLITILQLEVITSLQEACHPRKHQKCSKQLH